MKKIIYAAMFFLVITMMCGNAEKAEAKSYKAGKFKYQYKNTKKGVWITKITPLSSKGISKLNIPAKVKGKKVVKLGNTKDKYGTDDEARNIFGLMMCDPDGVGNFVISNTKAQKRIEKISLNRQQSDFLLETIELSGNARDYAICSTFLDSGIRLKELVGLNKSDIQVPLDENGFYILPDDVNSYIELHLRAETTKGQSKDRTTFITYDTLASLNDMIYDRITKLRKNTYDVYRPVIQRKKAEAEKTREELFLNQKGKRIGKRAVQEVIKKYAKLSDERIANENIDCPVNYGKNVSVHILRHTALSHYAEILTVAEVQSIAGHSNSQTTDKYIHVDREHIKQKLKLNNMKAM